MQTIDEINNGDGQIQISHKVIELCSIVKIFRDPELIVKNLEISKIER